MKKSLHLLKNKKGLTLVEVLISLFILAFIMGPILAIYVQSITLNKQSECIMDANYLNQKVTEELYTKTYEEALDSQHTKVSSGDYFTSLKIEPYGTNEDLFGSPPCYFHIVFTDEGGLYLCTPDGNYSIFDTAPSNITIHTTANTYICDTGGSSLSGSKRSTAPCAVIVNMMYKPASVNLSLELHGNCTAVVYCTNANESDVTIAGDKTIFRGLKKGDKSLIIATVDIYNDIDDTTSLAVTENVMQLQNF